MKEPQYIKIYQNLLNKIKTGELKDGDVLNTEMELTKNFNVSRVTVRKALEILVEKGFISRKQGRGSVVTFNKDLTNIDTKETISFNQTLNTDKRIIGFILPDISSSYGMKILEGIEEEAERLGFYLVMKLTKGDQKIEGKAIKDLINIGASGLIILPQHGEYFNPVIMELSLKEYPYVLIDLDLKGLKSSFVGTNNKDASFKAMSYLLDKGHKDILYISPSVEHTSTLEDRIEGAKSAFLAYNKPLLESNFLTTFKSTMPGCQNANFVNNDKNIMHDFFKSKTNISAIFASEYRLALLASDVLKELNLRIPEDVSIICFDSPTDYLGHYNFSHIRQDEFKMGTLAMERLNNIIKGDTKIQKIALSVDLIEGTTTQNA